MNSFKKFIFGNLTNWNDPFIIVVDTRNTRTGSSASNEWKFPQDNNVIDGYINFLVDWGDGQFSRIMSKAEALVPHVYATPGIYTLKFYKPRVNSSGLQLSPRYEVFEAERLKILKVKRFGRFNSSRGAFLNCTNLDFSDLQEEIINVGTESMFVRNTNLTTFGNVKRINLSGTSVNVFGNCPNFNQPNLEINLGTNTSCFGLFSGNISLTSLQFIYGSSLNNLNNMFNNCHSFNADLTVMTNIDWSKVTSMVGFMTKSTGHAKYVAYNPLYYDNLLKKLDEGGKTNITLNFSSKYTSVGATYRANLITKGWTISDLGLV